MEKKVDIIELRVELLMENVLFNGNGINYWATENYLEIHALNEG